MPKITVTLTGADKENVQAVVLGDKRWGLNGEPYDTVLDGLFIHFNPEDLITIRKELTRLGYSLERDDEKAAHAVGYGKLNF